MWANGIIPVHIVYLMRMGQANHEIRTLLNMHDIDGLWTIIIPKNVNGLFTNDPNSGCGCRQSTTHKIFIHVNGNGV